MRAITLQVQLEPDENLSENQLLTVQGLMLALRSELEKLGFVRCEMYYPSNEKWMPKC